MRSRCFLPVFLIVSLTFAQTEKLKPLTQAQVRQLVEAGVESDRLAKTLDERGIDFELSGDFLAALREKGALPAVLKALGNAGLKVGNAPLDKNELLELVRAGMDNLALVAAIEKRGIDFQPAADFLQALREAGALDALLKVLSENSPKPLAREQVLSLLAGGVANPRVAMLVLRRGLTFKPDAQYLDSLGVAGADEAVLLAVRTAKHPPAFVPLQKIEEQSGGIHPLAFTRDAHWLASAGGDLNVRLWGVADGKAGRVMGSHTDLIRAMATSPDGRFLASAGYDSVIKVWDLDSGSPVRAWRGHAGNVNALAFGPDSKLLASGGQDGTVKLWQVGKDAPTSSFADHNTAVTAVAFSPDGSRLASGQADTTLRVWDIAAGKILSELTGHVSSVNGLVFSPSGKLLASASADSTIKIWDAGNGRLLRTLTGHLVTVLCVAFSRDGRYLISGSADGSLRIWEVETGQEVSRLLEPGMGTVPTLALSLDGKFLAAARDDTLLIWRVEE